MDSIFSPDNAAHFLTAILTVGGLQFAKLAPFIAVLQEHQTARLRRFSWVIAALSTAGIEWHYVGDTLTIAHLTFGTFALFIVEIGKQMVTQEGLYSLIFRRRRP